MTRIPPVRMGVALAVTVGIGYALCTVVFWFWPEAAANFMNALFHGLDFRKLRAGDALFTFSSFAYGLVVLVAWAFMLGTLFGWLVDRLSQAR
jgi:large-conductance mechanosensitive channel